MPQFVETAHGEGIGQLLRENVSWRLFVGWGISTTRSDWTTWPFHWYIFLQIPLVVPVVAQNRDVAAIGGQSEENLYVQFRRNQLLLRVEWLKYEQRQTGRLFAVLLLFVLVCIDSLTRYNNTFLTLVSSPLSLFMLLFLSINRWLPFQQDANLDRDGRSQWTQGTLSVAF